MTTIKAIQTAYKGYHFRSRLEARWAVFFDALGLKWEYEPEGFELPGGVRYLPDFRITSPQGHIQWYEIKPEGVTSDAKFSAFKDLVSAENTDFDALFNNPVSATLLCGDPVKWLELVETPHGKIDGCACPRCGQLSRQLSYFSKCMFMHVHLGIDIYCWYCDMSTACGGSNPEEEGIFAVVVPHKGSLFVSPEGVHETAAALSFAAGKARSARFEFGQSGATK